MQQFDAGKPAEDNRAKAQPVVYFEYTGETGLTAIGSVTHNRYRFQGKGNQQAIDYRDVSGMLAVPLLRRVKAS